MDAQRKQELLEQYRALSPEKKAKFWEAIFGTDYIDDMTEEEIDEELRAAGYDPDEVARKGKELVERLISEHQDISPHMLPDPRGEE